MTTTKLEDEVSALRATLDDLTKRVRVGAVAEKFLAGDHEIRSGDFVRFEDGHAARVHINKHDGKWTYMNRNGSHIEPFRVPPEDGIERLYTIAEVAEIVDRVARAAGTGSVVPGVEFEPIDFDDVGDAHMTWNEFAEAVRSGAFTNDDGHGELATAVSVSNVRVYPSDISHMPRSEWATHVVWYNK